MEDDGVPLVPRKYVKPAVPVVINTDDNRCWEVKALKYTDNFNKSNSVNPEGCGGPMPDAPYKH